MSLASSTATTHRRWISPWRATFLILAPVLVFYLSFCVAFGWVALAEMGAAVSHQFRSEESRASDRTFIGVVMTLGVLATVLLGRRLERWGFGANVTSGLRPWHTRSAIVLLTLTPTVAWPRVDEEVRFRRHMREAVSGVTEYERAEALHWLGLYGSPRALPLLREKARIEGQEGRSAAGALAAVAGGKEELLVILRASPQYSPRWMNAALSLYTIDGDPDARRVHQQLALEHPDPAVRLDAVKRLRREQAEVLAAAMEDEQANIRLEAIARSALLGVAFERRVAASKALLAEPEPAVRAKGVYLVAPHAFGRSPDAEALRLVMERLGDEDANVRLAAADVSKKHAPAEALRVATAVASDQEASADDRSRAIAILGAVGDDTAIKLLRQLMDDETSDERVRRSARWALQSIERQATSSAPKK